MKKAIILSLLFLFGASEVSVAQTPCYTMACSIIRAFNEIYRWEEIRRTKEELQAVGGVVHMGDIGKATFPWQDMNPGELVVISKDVTRPSFDAMKGVNSAFYIEAPASVTNVTLNLSMTSAPGEALLAAIKQENITEGEWSFVEPEFGVVEINDDSPSAFRRWIVIPLFAQTCDYMDNGVIEVRVITDSACDNRPGYVTPAVEAAMDTRGTMGPNGEGFPLQPTQKLYFLTGADAPKQCSQSGGTVTCNIDFVRDLTENEIKAAVVHETFHAIAFWGLGRDMNANWLMESTAVRAEAKVYPHINAWLSRYDFGLDVTERGLRAGVKRLPSEVYNPGWWYHLESLYPELNLANFYRNQASVILDEDGIGAFASELSIDYGTMRELYGDYAKNYYQNLIPSANFGFQGLATVSLDTPYQLKVGRTVKWVNLREEPTVLVVELSQDAPVDTLLTFARAGEPGHIIAVDGALADTYPLGNLLPGDYTVTASSVEGTSVLDPDTSITISMAQDVPECGGGGPQLFDGAERGRAYDAVCNEMNYIVNISETASSYICPDTPGIDEVGRFVVTFEFAGDIRGLPWPAKVVGNRTNSSIPDQYWPTQYDSANEGGGCDQLGVYRDAWYSHSRNATSQTVSWYWNCAAGGSCGSPEARPPVW